MSELERLPRFRELHTITQWSATIPLDVPYDQFRTTIIEAAELTGQRFTGFITRHPSGNVASYTRTVYPRLKYGVTPLGECAAGVDYLAEQFGSTMYADELEVGTCRVLLGLFAGQDSENGLALTKYLTIALKRLMSNFKADTKSVARKFSLFVSPMKA